MNNFSCYSESTTDEGYQRPRYLELSIFGASKLRAISDNAECLQPYIRISQQEKEWETSVSYSTDSTYNWDELFELYIDLDHPFTITILDRDDFGSDALLGGFVVSPDVFLVNTENLRRLNLSISPIFEAEDVTFPQAKDQMIDDNSVGSVLSLGIRLIDLDAAATYSVKIQKHKNIVGSKEYFTLYEFSVVRNDQATWTVFLRFSQIEALRKAAIRDNPSVKKIKFPEKTFFNWVCCRRFSKFNENTINKRKVGLESFLNNILAETLDSRNKQLRSLLKIP